MYKDMKGKATMKTTFCPNHGVDIEEGDCCKECLLSSPEELAIARELITAINRDLALDYLEDDLYE